MGQTEEMFTFLMQLEKDRSRPEHADLREREFYGVSKLEKGNGKVRGEKALIDAEL